MTCTLKEFLSLFLLTLNGICGGDDHTLTTLPSIPIPSPDTTATSTSTTTTEGLG